MTVLAGQVPAFFGFSGSGENFLSRNEGIRSRRYGRPDKLNGDRDQCVEHGCHSELQALIKFDGFDGCIQQSQIPGYSARVCSNK